jgi:hypothetical protein
MSSNIIVKAIACAVCLGVVGCASNGELAKVRTEAELARQTADTALRTAEDAKSIAQEANSRSQRHEEMLNRGFKRSMYK